MNTWTLSDDTTVTLDASKLAVEGTSTLAVRLQGAAKFIAAGAPQRVSIAPEPGGSVALDLASAWLVDRWVQTVAAGDGLTVESDYEPSDDDVPTDARELLAERADDVFDDAAVY